MNKQEIEAAIHHLKAFADWVIEPDIHTKVDEYISTKVRLGVKGRPRDINEEKPRESRFEGHPCPPGPDTSYLTHDKAGRKVLYGYKKGKSNYGYYIDSNGLRMGMRGVPVTGKSMLLYAPVWGIVIPPEHLDKIELNMPI